MLKRLIEVALPLREVSEQSGSEKRQISALHMWWARRPLPTCRAVVFASLIPDPDDPECPADFRNLAMAALSRNEFKPKNEDGSTVEDTPRNRCLEFIKQLVKWENSNNPEYIEPARKLIAVAHKFLHPDAIGDAPKVLDPFAGGGAIPLEALRLGCEAYAVDLNPVAHLIELCTLVYPQKYSQPNSRSVPDYIKQLIANNSKRRAKGEQSLFDEGEGTVVLDEESLPDIEITEAEYRKNPLAADVKYWGHWLLHKSQRAIGDLYPSDSLASTPVAYLWARTVTCTNPSCHATVPLVRTLCLSKKQGYEANMQMIPDERTMSCEFTVGPPTDRRSSFSEDGTIQLGRAKCPFCHTVVSGDDLRSESKAGRMGEQLMAVVTNREGTRGKSYRRPNVNDHQAIQRAAEVLEKFKTEVGESCVPSEPITADRPSPNSRGLSAVVRYGFDQFGKLFNVRQRVALVCLAFHARQAFSQIKKHCDEDYAIAVGTYLGFLVDKHADHNSGFQRWHSGNQQMTNTFSRQALQMMWDYCEANPFSRSTGSAYGSLDDILSYPPLKNLIPTSHQARVVQGSATGIVAEDGEMAAILTDPPYYDSVPYSDLSDFFYVWTKRALAEVHPDMFRTPLTPKQQELIAYYGGGQRKVQKTPQWYERGMGDAFAEANRVLEGEGVCCVMFAHKTTTAWEAIIAGLLKAGLVVTASWPLHTEMKTRMVARNAAALASSVTLVCRKRAETAGTGLWDDVRQELKTVAHERLDFFWDQGIRGADFFISAIGPALSVFGKYERVTKLSGEEVTVGQFLDEVRGIVTSYALAKILKTTHTGTIDPESRFYVVWRWSYGNTKVPADESFKLSQALGFDTASLWDRTGVLEKSGENVQASAIDKRIKIKNLGEPSADGTPASLVDALHRMCAFREKNDMQGMGEFLGRSGHANNNSLWLVAQAVSEILSDGDKEKQLMQGLLNQKEGLEEAARERRLF